MIGRQVREGPTVFVNTDCAALDILSQYFAGSLARTWHMLFADDHRLETGGLFFVLRSVRRVPLSWKKTARVDTVAWVGFELFHRSCKLGISQRRAGWLIRWIRKVGALEFRVSYVSFLPPHVVLQIGQPPTLVHPSCGRQRQHHRQMHRRAPHGLELEDGAPYSTKEERLIRVTRPGFRLRSRSCAGSGCTPAETNQHS